MKTIKLKESEFDSFPNDFSVLQKVFEHYYEISFDNKKAEILNDHQKILLYHFICSGTIDNSGFYSILLETKGEFNTGYLISLREVGDLISEQIFNEIVNIYKEYEP